MIRPVGNSPNLLVNTPLKSQKAQGFQEILAAKTSAPYDTLLNKYRSMFDMTAVKVLDTSSIPGWDRKDFPMALLFDNDATIEDFQNVKLPEKEPSESLDPGIQEAWKNISKVNGVAFAIHPDAVKQINENPDFYSVVDKQLKQRVYPGMFDDIREECALPGGKVTDVSVVVEICADGTVNINTYTKGYLRVEKGAEEAEEVAGKVSDRAEKTVSFKRPISEIAVSSYPENPLNNYLPLYLRQAIIKKEWV